MRVPSVVVALVFVSNVAISSVRGQSPQDASAPAARVPWVNTRLRGSPEPPLPYTTEPIFTDVTWKRPLYAKSEPGTNRLLIVLQGGEKDTPGQIVGLDERSPSETHEFLSIEGRLIYGFAFDPDYQDNGWVYVFSNGPTEQPERTNRISRFQIRRENAVRRENADRCDPSTELILLQWRSMGHDGGELGFGNDGMLYISSGDGTTDSDVWLSGQDLSELLGGVLRIDVREATTTSPYKIPADNPFVNTPGARGEVWAYGLRNPWRLWCDEPSGQIWVGNNGQDLWESIHLVRKGENYGWSVYEGSHPFYPQRQRGPTEIVPPTIEHHHTEARSLTGGLVYRGARLDELIEAYIYGDYATGKIWGVRHDGSGITWHQELADTAHQIAGFATTPSGELIVVDHGGGLNRLVKSPATATTTEFPRKLSDTDLFESVKDHVLKPGIAAYSINAPGWNDHAVAERFVAIPVDTKIKPEKKRGWTLPDDAVVIQTLSLPDGESNRRIETRVLVRQQSEWAGYSYRWNPEQDDAVLVPRSGEDLNLESADGATIPWRIPSRSECMSCHSRAVNHVLGLSHLQLNRAIQVQGNIRNQIEVMDEMGYLESLDTPDDDPLLDPYDATQPLELRARSYLHVNCSPCHVEAGGGNARIALEFTLALTEMSLLSTRPQHATFEIGNAMLVAPGEPERSVLVSRVSRRGPGQMPPLVSRAVDRMGVELLRDWVAQMPRTERKFVRAWTTSELLAGLPTSHVQQSIDQGENLYRELGCNQCHRMTGDGGGSGPDLTLVAKRLNPEQLLQSMVEPSSVIAPEYALTMVATEDGRVLTGRAVFEDDENLHLRSPESFDTLMVIRKDEIEDRTFSRTSMMPAEILNSCTQEQIYDLIAYLTSPDLASVEDADQDNNQERE